jgi:hypothetical protein
MAAALRLPSFLVRFPVRKPERIDAATAAHNNMVSAMPEREIQQQLRTVMHRARTWYRLHGRKFRLPNDGSTKRKKAQR